jgi:hypothetical protein
MRNRTLPPALGAVVSVGAAVVSVGAAVVPGCSSAVVSVVWGVHAQTAMANTKDMNINFRGSPIVALLVGFH